MLDCPDAIPAYAHLIRSEGRRAHKAILREGAAISVSPKIPLTRVRVHDFVMPGLGRAIPYGVYDLGTNTGWVSVGIDHDTAAFAVESIRHRQYR